jgi:two-component system, cell cycle sensor histidine kinase and response regulator CckA
VFATLIRFAPGVGPSNVRRSYEPGANCGTQDLMAMTEPKPPLRVLVVEDNDADAELVVHQLERAGFDLSWTRVERESDFVAALGTPFDVILSDYNLPSFSAPRVLEILQAHNVHVPVIVVSGSVGEETAVQLLRAGAADYLLKDRLARLGQAVQRVLAEQRLAAEKHRVEDALQAAEQRTRFALGAARVGVWEAKLPGGIEQWSQTLEALHGLAPGSFGGTKEAFLACVHADDLADVTRAIDEATRLHTDSTIVYRTRWPDGTIHWISRTGRTFFDESDTPVRAAGIGLDVTERQLWEEQFRQAQKVESVGQLAGGIAHDFNNLLTAIQGYSELLNETLDAESPHREYVAEIGRASERAASLTRQLLAFSRRQILDPRVIDLRESLHAMRSMLKRLIGENVNVVFRTTEQLTRVKADPGQIEQVILNLALNARDAMPDGGTLLLEVTTVDLDEAYARRHVSVKPGPYVMLSVSDTGTGMDLTTQERIFEPFFTTKPRGRGTGLGLSTVYGIIKQSGGNIWVYSELGRGTTFKIYLPRVEEAVDQQATQTPPPVLAGSETILVVEDEPSVRNLVQKVLERYGYRVLTARAPHEAMALAEAHGDSIQLVISDVVLPEMSGRALVSQLTADRPGLRVMFMSGYTDNAIVNHGVLDPDTPFLQKPFTPAALARKVRELLE